MRERTATIDPCVAIILCTAFVTLFSVPATHAEMGNSSQGIQTGEEGVYLHVDKRNNELTVILNDTPVYRFPVATGKTNDLTPEGIFRIVTKVKDPWYLPENIPGGSAKNPLGTRWIGLGVKGTNGYKYGIHGTNRPASIGHNVSSGCIRMYNKDVEWLYRHIPLGTRVFITDGRHSSATPGHWPVFHRASVQTPQAIARSSVASFPLLRNPELWILYPS